MIDEIGGAWAKKKRQQGTPLGSLGIKEKSFGRFLGEESKVSKLARLHQDWSLSEVLVPSSDPWQASSRGLERDEAGDDAENCKLEGKKATKI